MPIRFFSFYFRLLFLFLTFPLLSQDTSSFIGYWAGDLIMPPYDIPLGVDIKSPKSGLRAYMDNPAQGSQQSAFDSIAISGDSIFLWIADIRFKLLREGSKLHGDWHQGDRTNSVELTYGSSLREPLRPQNPVEPFPYQSDTVSWKNALANISLEGTLTRPNHTVSGPAAILLTGSGPQTRDEDIFGHKIFAIIADYLTRKGMTVLRFDDRGFGNSEGFHSGASSYDFATDAASAYQFLLDSGNETIGFIGHSEGGLIAQIADSLVGGASFHIYLAAPGLPIWELMVEQNRLVYEDIYNEKLLKGYLDIVEQSFAIIRDHLPLNQKQDKINAITKAFYEELSKDDQMLLAPNQLAFSIRFTQLLYLTWWKYFLSYDPADYLRQIRAPILALNGEKDIQVTPENLNAIKDNAVTSSSVTVHEVMGHNHLFQKCHTCSLREYGLLTESFSPKVLMLMSDWLMEKNFLRE